MLQVENLSKNFGWNLALDDVSFKIEKGEVVGFLGPNGAGKTTAMRVISGYLAPSRGRVSLDGVDLAEDPIAVKEMIGYLPEQPPLYPEMTILEYLNFVARLKGVAKSEIPSRVEEAMTQVRITERANQLIRSLSKGYKQRTGLAGALVHRPPILILDEPTVGLDPNQIVEIRQLISDLKAADRTLIISTHILAEVEQTCERVIIINRGKIVASDTKANLLAGADGASEISIEVAREPERAIDLVKSLGGSLIEAEGSRLMAKIELDDRERVSRALVESGCGLLSFASRRPALEEIFMRLTHEAPLNQEGGEG